MKRTFPFLRPWVLLALASAAVVAALVWHGHHRLAGGYRQLLTAAATTPPVGAPEPLFNDAYHNAVALAFRDALARGDVTAVYFNDSVMGGHNDDEPRTTIATLLGDLSGLSIHPVSGPGYAATLFREYARLIAQAKHKPRLAIISINLRAFSDDWFFTPRWMYAATVDYLRLLAAPPTLADVPAWLVSGQDDPAVWLAARTRRDASGHEALFQEINARRNRLMAAPTPGLSPDEAKRRQFFIKNYMTDIPAGHPMIGDLLDTAATLSQAGVTTLFYLTPIDMEGGKSLVGEEFSATASANARRVAHALTKAGADCLDLSALLPEDRFVDRDYACEHLDLAGRRRVAEALAAHLAPAANPAAGALPR
ncbi:MAG: hypothetical protein B193_3765 [Solidesulfovibrio magneticus str. Maddingley MBC34]|uniref:SGNH hydrolase-type esterase domain-containing protein n=1 Tax=Solidesulfovibrio magneticus str. Maddingley MBC34 TaxID=1206767 RepID=K6GKV4_9BACT|nr:MAG: hypothetical protein B193_3765 [Solidesulfovibrio magneticus str. Maddingley MBC34]